MHNQYPGYRRSNRRRRVVGTVLGALTTGAAAVGVAHMGTGERSGPTNHAEMSITPAQAEELSQIAAQSAQASADRILENPTVKVSSFPHINTLVAQTPAGPDGVSHELDASSKDGKIVISIRHPEQDKPDGPMERYEFVPGAQSDGSVYDRATLSKTLGAHPALDKKTLWMGGLAETVTISGAQGDRGANPQHLAVSATPWLSQPTGIDAVFERPNAFEDAKTIVSGLTVHNSFSQ